MSDCLSEYVDKAFTILRNFLPSHFFPLRLHFKLPSLLVKGDKDDDGTLLAEAVEGGRPFEHNVGVADGFRLRGGICMGDARLRFLLDNSNRHRRILGMQGFADFDDDSFRLGVAGESDDLSLH